MRVAIDFTSGLVAPLFDIEGKIFALAAREFDDILSDAEVSVDDLFVPLFAGPRSKDLFDFLDRHPFSISEQSRNGHMLLVLSLALLLSVILDSKA